MRLIKVSEGTLNADAEQGVPIQTRDNPCTGIDRQDGRVIGRPSPYVNVLPGAWIATGRTNQEA